MRCFSGMRGESKGEMVWSDCVDLLGASESRSALSSVPDFAGSGSFSFLVFPAHTIFSLPILHAETIPPNLKKSEVDQQEVKSVEQREYEPEYFGALHRSGWSSGIWMDFFHLG
jgi:hypothetical protein